MRNLRSVDTVRVALAAALGLSSFACGGHATTSPNDGGPRFACADPTPLVIGGIDTGYDTCRGGTLRRRAIVDCPNLLPRPSTASLAACPTAGIDGGRGACLSDIDCAAMPFAFCQSGTPLGGFGCGCAPGCVRDSDCTSGEICVCGDPIGQCETASCNAGSCASGFACADYTVNPGCPGKSFACQTGSDECFSDSDCDAASSAGMCTLDVTSTRRACPRSRCVVGRPFLVAGDSRMAPVTVRSDWCARDVAPAVHSLSAETRARLAARWLDSARMEHASIAAFARFALQLLAVAAPPELIVAAQRALADETRHAQLTFGLASAYAGRDLGPGPLAVDACLDATDLRSLVSTVFAEGCIGETIAAVEARESVEHVRDPAVRAVLKTIAVDETRHAELAWRMIAWAIDAGEPRVREWVEAAIAQELAQADASAHMAPNESVCDSDLLAHGIVGEALRRQLRRAVLAEVVLPCARTLLGRRAIALADVATPV